MPELPEVETVVRGLRAVLPGRHIVGVRLGKTDFIEDPATMERDLPGSRIGAVRRHGKFLVIDLEPRGRAGPNLSLLIHLGMTGQILTCRPEAPDAPHTHAFFELGDGLELRYVDIRRFGSIQILSDTARDAILGELGLDALAATENEFRAQLQGRRARIKALLLDQHVLCGMGNIYTDESLFRARLHPARIAANLKEMELRDLYRAVQNVLTEAIQMRGSSVSDYVDSEGQPGGFQVRHRVYQRKGKKCLRCKTLIQRTIVAGRSSYFCPTCQPVPRTRKARPRKVTQTGG